MKITSCRLERAVFRPDDEPRAPGPDVAFLGRSNVGKSSLLNRLLGGKRLARTSSTPGRTQSVNVYRINESFHFVDLPGYGFARVPKQVRRSWGPLVEGFLERRRDRLRLAVLIIDARHGPTDLDLVMLDWLDDRRIPFLVAATKADKLSANDRAAASREMAQRLVGVDAVLVSAVTGLGITDLWRRIDGALGGSRGQAWTSGN